MTAKLTEAMKWALLRLVNGYRPRLHLKTCDALIDRGLIDRAGPTVAGREVAKQLRAAARAAFEADEMAQGAATDKRVRGSACVAQCRHSPSSTHVWSSGWSEPHGAMIERGTCWVCSAEIARAVPLGSVSATCRIPWVAAADLAPTPAGWTPELLTGLSAAAAAKPHMGLIRTHVPLV
jgi:hypothetical protein